MSDLLAAQHELLQHWLKSDDALRYARRLVARRSLRRSGEELLSEAWIRIDQTVANRVDPYPEMEDLNAARRYVGRVMDNLSRDMARAARRRNEVEFVDSFNVVEPHTHRVDGKLVLEQLVRAVGHRARIESHCPGCQHGVVAAAALEVLHMLLADKDGGDHGQSLLDRLLYDALDRVGDSTAPTPAARRQRKSRCGPCVTALLENGLRDIGVAL